MEVQPMTLAKGDFATPSYRPFTSSLPVGDLPALRVLGLRPLGVVQGFAVVRLKTFERFHPTLGFLNRGPGFRPGTPDAYFGSIYKGSVPSYYGLSQSRMSQVNWSELASKTPFDPGAERRHLSIFQSNIDSESMRRASTLPVAHRYMSRMRNFGIERFNATSVRTWSFPGMAFELGEVIQGFSDAYGASHKRLREEARRLGAHGVIGVVDSIKPVAGSTITEFHLTGTAVALEGEAPSDALPWTTFLPTQQLAKLIEVGLMPVEIVVSMSTVLLINSAYGNWIRSGQMGMGSKDLTEVRALQELALTRARERAYSQIGSDSLHGVTVSEASREGGHMIAVQECAIRGTRVRRFKETDPLIVPTTLMELT
jgi:hypothetical protein